MRALRVFALALGLPSGAALACDPVPTSLRALLEAEDLSGCFAAVIAAAPEDQRTYVTDTILDAAVFHGNLPLVQEAIDAGANLDGDYEQNWYPVLFTALRQGHHDIVEVLLESGADPSILFGGEEFQQQPLDVAVRSGNAQSVRLLLEAGADPTGVSEVSPLVAAVDEGHGDITAMLLDVGAEARWHPSTPEGTTLIEFALYGGGDRGPVVAALIAAGEDPSEPMSTTQLPLFVAASRGQGDAMRAIVGAGAPVDSLNRRGFTPLVSAAESGSLAAIPVLLELGADPDFDNGAAMYQADLNREDHVVAYLRAIGDPEAQQGILNDALADKITRPFSREAEALMREGADPNAWVGADHLLNQVQCYWGGGHALLDGGADPALMMIDGDWPAWLAECAVTEPGGADYVARLGYAP